jgi:hypothetical protein
MPKKGTRQIVVGGVRYRWRISKRVFLVGLGMGDRVIVEHVDANGAPLIANLPYDFCDEPALTPKHVARWIEEALEEGWKPTESGPPFQLGEAFPRKPKQRFRPMPQDWHQRWP